MKKNTLLTIALLSVVAVPSAFGFKLNLKNLREKFQEIKKTVIAKVEDNLPGAVSEVKKQYANLKQQVDTVMKDKTLNMDQKFAQLKALRGQSRQALNQVKNVIKKGANVNLVDIHDQFKKVLTDAKLKVDSIGQ